jgi:hypothetical protein
LAEERQNMVITVLEGHVAAEKWETLEEAYKAGTESLPAVIVQTFLVQHMTEPTLWRIMTCWQDREALEAYRQSVETPGGILMFRAAGAEPTLSILDVRAHASSGA